MTSLARFTPLSLLPRGSCNFLALDSAAPIEVEFASMQTHSETSLVEEVCLPFLKAARNDDGGWGFHAGSESRVEATAWAVLALTETGSSRDLCEAAYGYLRATQLPDGSWPPSRAQSAGCWATSLACWALSRNSESQKSVAAGLRWICDDWPRDVNLIQRVIQKISWGKEKEVVSQNASLHGWGWTPWTASWVEPTAFALIAFDQASVQILPPEAARRRKLAKAMLYNRMCPGGAWNCGNPMVYGVPGDPLVEPTVWALLATRDEPRRPENLMSIEWLEKNLPLIRSARSLALAKLCWDTYGREWPAHLVSFRELHGKNEFLNNVPAMAWTSLALCSGRKWLQAIEREKHN